MSTYNLNQTQLFDVLAAPVSAATQGAIYSALRAAGEYPTGNLTLPTYDQTDTGTAHINLATDSIGLFVEQGSNVTVDVDSVSPYGAVIAAGDGQNVILNDVAGLDTLVGGAGPDTLIGGGASDLMAGTGSNLLIGGHDSLSADTLQGGSGADTLQVSAGNNLLIAGGGNDSISGGAGSDTIYGGPGSDTINSGSGLQNIYTGSGQDSINATGHDTIYVGYNNPYNSVIGGFDSITGTANTTIDIEANYTNATKPFQLGHSGNYIVTFSQGSASTTVEFNSGVTLNYLNKTGVTPT